MTIKRSIATVLAGAAIAVGAFAHPASAADTGTAASPDPNEASCVNGHWPGVVDGKPTQLQAGAHEAVYLWHDTTGWHLRATHPGTDKKIIRGQLRSDGEIYAVARYTEGNDVVAHTASRHAVSFRFTNWGHIDGLDFKVRCGKHLNVNGAYQGTKLQPSQVFLGAGNTNPAKVPFMLKRVK